MDRLHVENRAGARTEFSADRFLGTLIRAGVDPAEAVPMADALALRLLSRGGGVVSTDELRFVVAELAGRSVTDLAVDRVLSGLVITAPIEPLLKLTRVFTPLWFGAGAGAPKQCSAPNVRKVLVYSRGNNDEAEMTKQKAATGTYVYETGQFTITILLDAVGCLCDGSGKCAGNIKILVRVKYAESTAYASDPVSADFSLEEGPAPSAPTKPLPGPPPGGGMDVTMDPPTFGPAVPKNKFSQPDKTKREFVADADSSVPCKAGSYHKRFWLNSSTVPPGPGGLCAWVDCQIDVTEPAACTLDVKLKAYFLEFRENYDFTHGGKVPGADVELPEVRHQETGGKNAGRTRNIAKLISENGTAVDTPYAAKAP
jgi:hypothetical protein